MSVGRLLNTTITVWRPTLDTDEGGGAATTLVELGTQRARLSQPSATERELAARNGARLTHTVYLKPGANVVRGDELRTTDGRRLEVLAVFEPSKAVYTRADCEARQETP